MRAVNEEQAESIASVKAADEEWDTVNINADTDDVVVGGADADITDNSNADKAYTTTDL